MQADIEQLTQKFESDLKRVERVKDLEDLKVKYLGKKGPISSLMIELKHCPKDQRPHIGQSINQLKTLITDKIEAFYQEMSVLEQQKQLAKETIDIALPGRKGYLAASHILSQMMDEVLEILISMGFSVQYAPELESEYYNYEGLNYPEDHPARDMQDTFYINERMLLRSHTTNVQQHILQSANPPVRTVCMGKCYRNETISSRSHVIFHQFDGLYIDKKVTFKDLLATKEEFYSRLFKKRVELRTRPSYFPFVEPGMEIDIRCTSCGGNGCSLCKYTGWLEVCGAGMVHPKVLQEGGLDPDEYSGFAWGGGIERLCLLRHGIPDIRLFMENDMRFLRQFS